MLDRWIGFIFALLLHLILLLGMYYFHLQEPTEIPIESKAVLGDGDFIPEEIGTIDESVIQAEEQRLALEERQKQEAESKREREAREKEEKAQKEALELVELRKKTRTRKASA